VRLLELPFGDLDAAADEYPELATMFATVTMPGGRLCEKSNRHVWSLCLDADAMAKLCTDNGRPAPFRHVFHVVRLYNSILDGTVMVERDFALIRKFLDNTGGHGGITLLEDVLVVRCSRPPLADMAPVDGVCRGELGDFGLACAKLWREVHGARLGIGRDICAGDAILKGRRTTKKTQGVKHIKKGVLKAAGHVARLGPLGSRPVLGHASGGQEPGVRTNKFWNEGLTA
jgi:hypothetical protein